jgi:hypothetical protein
MEIGCHLCNSQVLHLFMQQPLCLFAEREGLPAVNPGRRSQEKMKIRYRSFIFLLLQRHQAKLKRFQKSKMPLSGHFIFSCGERGKCTFHSYAFIFRYLELFFLKETPAETKHQYEGLDCTTYVSFR